MSLLKLIKLVYLAYGWSIALDYRLFDEPIVAWKHGPVIRSLYHEFKHFGAAPIKGTRPLLISILANSLCRAYLTMIGMLTLF